MGQKTFRTLCQFCHNNCGVIAEQKANGNITVKGDPAHPINNGYCCPKVVANVEIQSSPDRLTHPLRKTPTGFKRISWDEALTIAADKLGEIRNNYGPLSLVRCSGAPVSYQARDGFLEFMGAYGSPNLTSVANICMAPRMMAFKSVFGAIRAEPDYDNTKLALFWGSNPVDIERYASYAAYGGMKKILPRLKERGVRTICIDPYQSKTAKQVDQWIRIKPGGDNALGLAMIHVIIRENLYDKDFVENYTSGFEELQNHVKSYDPQWAEQPTGLSTSEIENLARTYATSGPAAIYEGNGLDMYANGVDAVRTIAILIGLTGNIDVPGGNVLMPFPHPPALPTKPAPMAERIGYDRFPAPTHAPFPVIKEALLNEENGRPRAMIVHHGNPVLTQAQASHIRQALAKLDFLMVCDIFPTATTELADLILPITSDFEAYGYRGYLSAKGAFLALARPVVEPVGEARSVFEVEYDLAKKMNLHQDYPFKDDQSWVGFMVKPSGTAFEQLEAEQIVYVSPPVQFRKYEEKGFDTPSGKLEFYSRWFEKLGIAPLPSYNHPAGKSLDPETLAAQGYSLLGSNRRPSQFVHTRFKNLPKTSKSYPEPLVYMHPQDAEQRGIAEGVGVEIKSPQGCINLKAALTQDTTPGLVWIDFGWGNPTDGKANINDLVDDQHMDPISGGTPHRLFACEVRALP
jgi:anaerobic selenocysteine-containing dehydrogenase